MPVFPQDRDPLRISDEGIIKLRIAIVQQAAIDIRKCEKKLARMEKKYPYCVECEHDGSCMWRDTRKKGKTRQFARSSLKEEYDATIRLKEDAENFLASDWCEEISGITNGYILDRLRRETTRTRQKGTRL